MTSDDAPNPGPITRATDGRWLGGVCAGLAAARIGGRRVSALWARLGFVVLAGFGGIGIVLYVACWLILPGQSAGGARGPRGVVIAVKAIAGVVALIVLAAVGAAATVFGFGWWVFAGAAAVLVAALGVRRLGPAWALLPVLALTGPSVAAAVGGIRIIPRDGQTVVRVASTAALARPYRSGLDTLLVDLRRTPLPARGRLTVHVRAGLRRTIVALPASRCVHVVVRTHGEDLAERVGGILAGNSAGPDAIVFGQGYAAGQNGAIVRRSPGRGPTLVVDFRSIGGSLFVRDYPDRIDPDLEPDWPGYPVPVESRPEPPPSTRHALNSWRARQEQERAELARYERSDPGPCGR